MKHYKFKRSLFHRSFTMVWSYGSKSGGPILRGEPRLRNINGFALFLPGSQHWWTFRRHSK